MELVRTTENRPVGNEVTPEDQAELKKKFEGFDQVKQKKLNKEFTPAWINDLLHGTRLHGTRRRFKTEKVKRFIERLK
jgi:hypothetical protein